MLAVLAWIPPMVSAVLLGTLWVAFWIVGEGSLRNLGPLTAWFLVAVYLQLFAGSLAFTTTGLVLQVILAIYLIIQVKLRSRGV